LLCSVDPFSKKDWYDIKAPTIFTQRSLGKTLVTRTAGTKIASDGLKGRVFEVSLADLQQDEDQAFRKIKLRAEDVQGKNVLTNFWVSVSRPCVFVRFGLCISVQYRHWRCSNWECNLRLKLYGGVSESTFLSRNAI
jgi:hypothetical protein